MTVLTGSYYSHRLDTMGRLIDMMKQKCEECRRVALPRSISGRYLSGEPVVLHECSFCGYLRQHSQLGLHGLRKQKSSNVTRSSQGRLSRYLRQMAKKL